MKAKEKVEIDADSRLMLGREEDRKSISMSGTKTLEQTLSDGK